ncbi:hypothetical protein BC829DRAFT_447357 [Chytridium lagenaria]|nr:hypothetical protein BC829DRAFT_447357 [Chytridium lagenaria]
MKRDSDIDNFDWLSDDDDKHIRNIKLVQHLTARTLLEQVVMLPSMENIAKLLTNMYESAQSDLNSFYQAMPELRDLLKKTQDFCKTYKVLTGVMGMNGTNLESVASLTPPFRTPTPKFGIHSQIASTFTDTIRSANFTSGDRRRTDLEHGRHDIIEIDSKYSGEGGMKFETLHKNGENPEPKDPWADVWKNIFQTRLQDMIDAGNGQLDRSKISDLMCNVFSQRSLFNGLSVSIDNPPSNQDLEWKSVRESLLPPPKGIRSNNNLSATDDISSIPEKRTPRWFSLDWKAMMKTSSEISADLKRISNNGISQIKGKAFAIKMVTLSDWIDANPDSTKQIDFPHRKFLRPLWSEANRRFFKSTTYKEDVIAHLETLAATPEAPPEIKDQVNNSGGNPEQAIEWLIKRCDDTDFTFTRLAYFAAVKIIAELLLETTSQETPCTLQIDDIEDYLRQKLDYPLYDVDAVTRKDKLMAVILSYCLWNPDVNDSGMGATDFYAVMKDYLPSEELYGTPEDMLRTQRRFNLPDRLPESYGAQPSAANHISSETRPVNPSNSDTGNAYPVTSINTASPAATVDTISPIQVQPQSAMLSVEPLAAISLALIQPLQTTNMSSIAPLGIETEASAAGDTNSWTDATPIPAKKVRGRPKASASGADTRRSNRGKMTSTLTPMVGEAGAPTPNLQDISNTTTVIVSKAAKKVKVNALPVDTTTDGDTDRLVTNPDSKLDNMDEFDELD